MGERDACEKAGSDTGFAMKEYDPILWYHAVWKTLTAIVVVVGGSLPTVVLGWDTMLVSGKVVAIGGLVVSAWKAVDLLFDQTMRRLSQGKTPMPINGNNDTQHFTKPPDVK